MTVSHVPEENIVTKMHTPSNRHHQIVLLGKYTSIFSEDYFDWLVSDWASGKINLIGWDMTLDIMACKDQRENVQIIDTCT